MEAAIALYGIWGLLIIIIIGISICRYVFRTNKIVDLLQDIKTELKKLNR